MAAGTINLTENQARLVLEAHFPGTFTYASDGVTCQQCEMTAPTLAAHFAERLAAASAQVMKPDEAEWAKQYWLNRFVANGIPMWAAVRAWDEADDDDTVDKIRDRAKEIADSRPGVLSEPRTPDEKRAFSRAWDAQVEAGKRRSDRAKEIADARPKTTCGAQSWGWAGDIMPNGVWLYGTCGDDAGHGHRFHHEYRDGKLWAEWSGDSASRVPENAVIVNPR